MKLKSELEREPLKTRVELHPFLVGLRPHQTKLFADCALATHFAAGEYLFRQGEFANRFYLIEEGQVVLESADSEGEPMVVEKVGPGKLIGWSWLFPPYVWHFDARATQATEAIFFYGTILREYCEREPSLGYELFKRMSLVMIERLQNARLQLLRGHREAEQTST